MSETPNITVSHITMLYDDFIKFERIEFNKALNLFVGRNAAGKSLIFKHLFFANNAINLLIAQNPSTDGGLFSLNYLFNACLSEPDFTGKFECIYSNGTGLSIICEKGVIKNYYLTVTSDKGEVPPMRYLSSAMRTFDAIHAYVRVRNLIMKMKNISQTHELIPELLDEGYKLYDIMHCEALIARSPIEYKFDSEMAKHYDFKEEETPLSLEFDSEKSEFFTNLKNGSKKYLSSYGAGHQSILNMRAAY